MTIGARPLAGTPIGAAGVVGGSTPESPVAIVVAGGSFAVVGSAAVVGILIAAQLVGTGAGDAAVSFHPVGVVSGSVAITGDGRYLAGGDLVRRFGRDEIIQISNPDAPQAVEIDTDRVGDAMQDVEALIEAKLSARYSIPLRSVPRVLRNIACDLVRARLYEDRITDRVREREKDALKLLDQIAAGQLSLGLDDAQQATTPVDGPQFTEPARVFSGASLADYNG